MDPNLAGRPDHRRPRPPACVMTCLIGYAILWKEGLSLFQLKKLGETVEP